MSDATHVRSLLDLHALIASSIKGGHRRRLSMKDSLAAILPVSWGATGAHMAFLHAFHEPRTSGPSRIPRRRTRLGPALPRRRPVRAWLRAEQGVAMPSRVSSRKRRTRSPPGLARACRYPGRMRGEGFRPVDAATAAGSSETASWSALGLRVVTVRVRRCGGTSLRSIRARASTRPRAWCACRRTQTCAAATCSCSWAGSAGARSPSPLQQPHPAEAHRESVTDRR